MARMWHPSAQTRAQSPANPWPSKRTLLELRLALPSIRRHAELKAHLNHHLWAWPAREHHGVCFGARQRPHHLADSTTSLFCLSGSQLLDRVTCIAGGGLPRCAIQLLRGYIASDLLATAPHRGGRGILVSIQSESLRLRAPPPTALTPCAVALRSRCDRSARSRLLSSLSAAQQLHQRSCDGRSCAPWTAGTGLGVTP